MILVAGGAEEDSCEPHQPIHPHETTGMIVADCTAARRVHFLSGARPMQGLIEQSRSGKIWMRPGHF